MFNSEFIEMFGSEIGATLYMVLVSSLVSYVIGLPLGVLLVVTDEEGIHPMPLLNKVVGLIVNLLRSVPFLIMIVIALPLTRAVVGTTLGATAVIPPLVVSAAPYVARMVESSFKEVDRGVIEAAKSMGASTSEIILKVLIPESKPSLLVGAAISITTILGYSAMAGNLGGGGLGAIAINYGYYRREPVTMWVAVILLMLLVQVIQELGLRLARHSDKRAR
ncbi:MAG TPA: ABC transporter permease [Candidatus Avilachnospira avistercoris]|nr:ABC transporter permease [Candidatus Avilachnospira avistercoris]